MLLEPIVQRFDEEVLSRAFELDGEHAELPVRRLGRVNRAGLGSATVMVVHEGLDPAAVGRFGTAAGRGARRSRCCGASRIWPRGRCGTWIRKRLARCSVSRVTIAQLDTAMVESYALTSADLVRSPVEVYLRGVADEPEAPETWVAWAGTSRTWFGQVRRWRRRPSRSFGCVLRSSRGSPRWSRSRSFTRRSAARRGGDSP